MVSGHLQEKKGYYYAVLSYYDKKGKRHIKYVSTGLPVKGNKRKAEAKLVELCPATMVFWYTYSYIASDEISGYESDSWFGYVNMIDLKLSDWRDVNSKEAEVLEARDPKNK